MKKILLIFGTILLLALSACSTQQSSQSSATKQPKTAKPTFKISKAEASKIITLSKNTLGPVVNVIHKGDTVTWSNKDAKAHQLVSYPNAPQSFEVDVKANNKATHTFTKPGVYRYYGKDSATYSKKMGDVKANKNAEHYPAPLRGVVVVLNKKNTLPAAKDATITIPASTMLFTPWNLTVNKGTTVTWMNHDDMAHMVASAPGFSAKQMKVLSLKKGSGQGKITFNQPGVYYYFCPMHARWQTKSSILIPQKSFGSYPYVMDGLIIVNP